MNNTGKYLDLHCHLDGSITPEIAKKLAELQGIKIPAETDEELENIIRVTPSFTKPSFLATAIEALLDSIIFNQIR